MARGAYFCIYHFKAKKHLFAIAVHDEFAPV
jgi:hypothetical protein